MVDADGRGVPVEKEPQPLRIVLSRGGRIEGRARHRDGRPFEDGRVAASPIAGNAGFSGEPTPTLADGSFVIEHVPAGRVLVSLMTRVSSHPQLSGGPGMATLVGVTSREVELREAETVSVELATREVVVAGRVTRGGQGLAGVVVNVSSRDGGADDDELHGPEPHGARSAIRPASAHGHHARGRQLRAAEESAAALTCWRSSLRGLDDALLARHVFC